MHHFWDNRLQIHLDLENRVRGLSRSLEMLPFDRQSYYCTRGNYT